ncbi:MAG TPA: hypothetical protein VH352_02835, partial [Pseudonocardiaceae bacterium]|nr:hypothetical protein [Pseudonocardiaceae bacterium]
TSYEQRPAGYERWPALRHGDVYGLSEIGDVAWQEVDSRSWDVHEDLVHVEILPTVTDGSLVVGELVATDLTNDVMPLVRYRTGDLAVGRQVDGRLVALHQVVGRRIAARGTALAGVDLLSTMVPTLLDTGCRFAVGAGVTHVGVWLEDASDQAVLAITRRLADELPLVRVSSDPGVLAGLQSVLKAPDLNWAAHG